MKIRPSKSHGNLVMELDKIDSVHLPVRAGASPFRLREILVPIDFSDCSKKALQYAVPFAKQFCAAIVLLHVVPRRCAMAEKSCEQDFGLEKEINLRDNAARKLTEIANDFIPREVPVRIETCLGAEAIQIAAEAKESEADLIVIATHGRTGRARELAGSVAESLVQLAPCPVLVVREYEREFIQDELENPFSNAVS